MYVTLTIINYPRLLGIAGFFSMLFFRFFLAGKKKIIFYKLMGTGLNGSFDLRPDTRQWVIMSFSQTMCSSGTECNTNTQIKNQYGKAIARWLRFFRCETAIFQMNIISGHGKWDGKSFTPIAGQLIPEQEPIAIFTRATIRLNKLQSFWKAVPKTNKRTKEADGLLFSLGAGEIPAIRQSTFSIWASAADMKAFAYNTPEHVDVIQRTRKECWYAEEMFLRMKLISACGSVKGKDVKKML